MNEIVQSRIVEKLLQESAVIDQKTTQTYQINRDVIKSIVSNEDRGSLSILSSKKGGRYSRNNQN